jgi:hypothetical protein
LRAARIISEAVIDLAMSASLWSVGWKRLWRAKDAFDYECDKLRQASMHG